jgi:uncharacterized protein (TIGR02284 family)
MKAVAQLEHLARIDMDAVRAYTQAIDNVDETDVSDMLRGFRSDHERHIRDLSAAISSLGRRPPERPHLSSLAIEGFTAIASGTSVSACLMAMQSNEVVTTQAYQMALEADFPGDIRDLLQRNYADEQRHLAAIRERLEAISGAGRVMSSTATWQGLGTSAWLNVIVKNPVTSAVAGSAAALLLGAAGTTLWKRRSRRAHP